MLSDVGIGNNSTKYVEVDGKAWVVVVRGKVAIALNGPLTAEWRAGGAKVHVARTSQERVMMVRIPRVGARKSLALVAAYAPIHAAPRRVRMEFWDQLTTVMRASASDDIVFVGGDFNADVAANSQNDWPRVTGRFGSLRTSQGGQDMLSWCTRHGMVVMDTFFAQPMQKRFTWWHPARGTGHGNDHFLAKGICFRFVDGVRTVHEGRRRNAEEPLGRPGHGRRGVRGAPGGRVFLDV